MTGKLIILGGPTTVGKTTNTKEVITQSQRYTTRKKRESELSSQEYNGKNTTHGYFVSKEEFLSLASSEKLVGVHEYANHLYGFNKAAIDEQLQKGNTYEQVIPIQTIQELQEAFPGNTNTKAYLTTLHDATQRLQYRDGQLSEERRASVPKTVKEYIKNIHLFDDIIFNFNTVDAPAYTNILAEAIYLSGICIYCNEHERSQKVGEESYKVLQEQQKWRKDESRNYDSFSIEGFHVLNEETGTIPIFDLLAKGAELYFSYYFKHFSPGLEEFPLLKAQNTQLIPTFIAGVHLEDFDFEGWEHYAREAIDINKEFYELFNQENKKSYNTIEESIDNIVCRYPVQEIMKKNLLSFLADGETADKAMYLHYNFRDIQQKIEKARLSGYDAAFQMSLYIKDPDFDPDEKPEEITINALRRIDRQKEAIELTKEQQEKFDQRYAEARQKWLDNDEWRDTYGVRK